MRYLDGKGKMADKIIANAKVKSITVVAIHVEFSIPVHEQTISQKVSNIALAYKITELSVMMLQYNIVIVGLAMGYSIRDARHVL